MCPAPPAMQCKLASKSASSLFKVVKLPVQKRQAECVTWQKCYTMSTTPCGRICSTQHITIVSVNCYADIPVAAATYMGECV